MKQLNNASFAAALVNANYQVNGTVISDEMIHRCGKEKECWYVCGHDWGIADDWSHNLERVHWYANNAYTLSPEKWAAINARIEAEKAKRALEHEEVAKDAERQISVSRQTGVSNYLLSKKVGAYGVYFSTNQVGQVNTIIPARDTDGKLWTLQKIYDDGSKYFLQGGRKSGCFHVIGEVKEGLPTIFGEGYATCASVYEAVGYAVVVCFDAGNLNPVIKAFREEYPTTKFIIAGDNDAFKKENTGKIKAEEVAEKYGGTVVLPQFSESSLQLSKPTDFNDLMLLEGINVVKYQLAAALKKRRLKAVNITDFLKLELLPREMLLSPIIPMQGLVMLHAARGIGKTYVSLTIAAIVSCGGQMFGNKWNCSKPRKVVFIDGEMPATVLQERAAAIIAGLGLDNKTPENLVIITPDLQDEVMPDISTVAGQTLIEEYLSGAHLLIIDNLSALCRTGRENDAESWVPIQGWFLSLRKRGISVLFIHHSNKNQAQRGTSKKEDLLDTVITLKHPHDYERSEGARFEVHYEKARGFYGEEAKPFEAKLKLDTAKMVWEISDIEHLRQEDVMTLKREGLTQREIAKELGTSAATVNRILHRAKVGE